MTAQIIPFIPQVKEKPVERFCSFCKEPEAKVRSLISSTASPRKCICDKCVARCTQRIADES